MGYFLASREWDMVHTNMGMFLQGIALLWVTFTVACTAVVNYIIS